MYCPSLQNFQNDVLAFTARLAEFEKKVEPLSYPDDENLLTELEEIMSFGLESCHRINHEIKADAELLKETQTNFREATATWCNQSWIMNRARTKPRGFPGDYQMLMAIYDGVPLARGLGGYLDRWCLQMTLGRAVNSRLELAKTFLLAELSQKTKAMKVLDIASGPGREFRSMHSQNLACEVEISCLDTDEGALEYVRRHVQKQTPANFTFHFSSHNAFRLRSPEKVIKLFGRQDIIYSVGLADYIPDRLLVPMLASWKDALNPEGCVYVAFKDKNYYDEVEYQWLMDWSFVQRDEQECRNLLEQAGYDMNNVEVGRDQTGVIITFLARPAHMLQNRFSQMKHQPSPPIRAANSSVKRTSVDSSSN
ncbi:MAG: class I SAM-dependent methyltransferase [Planctomycetaceae bacterium]|nr:class I SAM-dependent methyltransferase [Planctomycetaceae bacterium]